MKDWLDALIAYRNSSTPCVLVTVVETMGSVPRGAGVKMLVAAETVIGTVGGGALEQQVIEFGRRLLAQKGKPIMQVITAVNQSQPQDQQDQIADCAVGLRLLFEPLFTRNFEIYLFGAGHVGKALVHVLAPLTCRLHWIDARDNIFPAELLGNIFINQTDKPEEAVAEAAPGSYFLVMTPSHETDFKISEAVLLRADFAYCGMIGSARKLRQFEHFLKRRGHSLTLLEKLHCPMGLDSITDREPAAIAIAIAAELLQIQSVMWASRAA